MESTADGGLRTCTSDHQALLPSFTQRDVESSYTSASPSQGTKLHSPA